MTVIIKYHDLDGDWVTLTTTAELTHALASAEARGETNEQQAVLHLRVLPSRQPTSSEVADIRRVLRIQFILVEFTTYLVTSKVTEKHNSSCVDPHEFLFE